MLLLIVIGLGVVDDPGTVGSVSEQQAPVLTRSVDRSGVKLDIRP